MADIEGVSIKITADSSQATREFSKLKAAASKIASLEKMKMKVDWDIQHPNIDFSQLRIPANFGMNFGQQITDGLSQASGVLNNFGTQLQATFGGALSIIKKGLLGIIGTGGLLTNEFRKALTIGGGFEATMTSVSVVSSSTAEEMAQLTAKAREMGATLPITAQQAGQAMLIMAQRGDRFEQIMANVNDVANLSIFQGTDMATAAGLLGSTMSQFSLKTEEASRIVDIFNNACNQSPLNMSLLVDAMQYVGPAAGGMGMKLEEVVAGLEALHASGLKGSMAGTGLRMVLQKLAAKTQIAGVETKKLDGSTRSLSEIFSELKEHGYSLAEATKDFGARGANAAISLMKLSGSLENYERGLQRVGTTSAGVQEKMKTWPNVWNAFRSATEELHIEIFEQIKEQSKEAMSGIANLTRAFSSWIKESELGKKVLDAFLKGLKFNVPSVDDFKKILDSLDVNAITETVKSLGASLRGIGESIVSFFNSVKTPLLFLIENLGTFMTISFWGWIIGSGMRIASIVLSLGSAINFLCMKLTGLSILSALSNPLGLIVAGSTAIAGGLMYATSKFAQSKIEAQKLEIEAQKLEAEKKNAEAELKKADEELRYDLRNIKIETGFEELPESYKVASGELKAEIKEDIFYIQEQFKDKIAGLFTDIKREEHQNLLLKDGFSTEEIEERLKSIVVTAADISDEMAKSISNALNGSKKDFDTLSDEAKKIFANIKAESTVEELTKMGVAADTAKKQFTDFYNEYLNWGKKETTAPLSKMQLMFESVKTEIKSLVYFFPEKIEELNASLGGNKIDLAVELSLTDAKKSLEEFVKKTSKETGFSQEVINEQVFDQLNRLAAAGNATAQSLANSWENSGKGFDDFLQKAQDYVTYMNVAPEKFTPTLEKMFKGLQKIDPMTGKITEQFKKGYNALKQWASVTFDKLSQRIQRLRKAMEGGFIDKKSLEEEYRKVSGQIKAQVVLDLQDTKGSYSDKSQYQAVLASEYMSRLEQLGGDTFVEMAKKEFSNSFAKTGSAIGEMIERTARSTSYTQTVRVDGKEISQSPQNSQGFNIQSFTQALNPVVSGIQQIASQNQAVQSIDYSSSIATIIAEIKNTNVGVQNVKIAVDNLSNNMTSTFTGLENVMKTAAGNGSYNIEINQTGFTVQQKSDADNLARLAASAVRQGLGNGGV